jgi:hypothetical protein
VIPKDTLPHSGPSGNAMSAKKGVLVLLGNAPPYTAVKVANSVVAGLQWSELKFADGAVLNTDTVDEAIR